MQRFTISLEEKLAEDFDIWIADRSYSNRSEAVRDLLRAELGRSSVQDERSQYCIASLSYVFNHRERELTERLAGIQHSHHDLTVSAMHVALDHEHCMQTLILKGSTQAVKQLSDAVCAERGVHHGRLNLVSVEAHAPHSHERAYQHVTGNSSLDQAAHLHFKPSH
jgi:CopG family nickel-responsive transcriptional regulator